jgi:hypothetical protein
MGVGSHHPQPTKPDVLPPNYPKPDKLPPEAVLDGLFATVTAVLYFFFFVISTESLKNHSKSQKNRKMKNLVLLDST